MNLQQLKMLPPEIEALATATRAMAANHTDTAEFYQGLIQVSTWEGTAADAARASIRTNAGSHEATAEVLTRAATAMDVCEDQAQVTANQITREILDYAAERNPTPVRVDQLTNQVIPPDTSYLTDEAVAQVAAKIATLDARIAAVLTEGRLTDADLARAIIRARSETRKPETEIRRVDNKTFKDAPANAEPETNRHQNQVDAFKQVFGRDPVSQSDWTTASVLDPHSYDSQNQGQPPNIVVGRIKPVPGQGVVRTNLFIPGEKAWTPMGDNLGDNRGFDPKAGPEASRVAIYTDYDNGIVVARQNPSVMQGSDGTQVNAGHPDIRVSQNSSGSVEIRYHAADPFSPGGEDLAMSTPWNVNGDYVIKPTSTGPIVGGTISDFPAVEFYNDNGGRTTDLGHIMPQNTTVFGPLAGLPLSQQIGPGLMGEFPDTVIPGTSATSPAPIGLPQHVPHTLPSELPIPVVKPYPSVMLGPVGSIPQVPIGK